MAYENKSGIGVFNQYGPRHSGNTAGTDDDFDELTLEFSGNSLQSTFLPPCVIPKGARIQRATLFIDEGFTLTGTSPTVQVGGTAPGTNGASFTATDLGTVGAIDVSSKFAGTWATNSALGTTASEKVTIALGGTTPAVTPGVGKATLWVEFRYKKRP
jgi:hypothetical protein